MFNHAVFDISRRCQGLHFGCKNNLWSWGNYIFNEWKSQTYISFWSKLGGYKPFPSGAEGSLTLFFLHITRTLSLPFLSSGNMWKILTKMVGISLYGIGLYCEEVHSLLLIKINRGLKSMHLHLATCFQYYWSCYLTSAPSVQGVYNYKCNLWTFPTEQFSAPPHNSPFLEGRFRKTRAKTI